MNHLESENIKQDESQKSSDLKTTNSTFDEFIKFLRDIIILLIIVFTLRSFVIAPFQISGTSMENNYHDKEIILIDIISYLDFNTHFDDTFQGNTDSITSSIFGFFKKIPIHFGDPKRGDVVVIKPHVDKEREFYLKRIIGLPGETIKFEKGNVFIKLKNTENFVQLDESSYLSVANNGNTFLPSIGNTDGQEFTIPEGTYWVMGDNRIVSADSRGCFKDTCLHKNSTHFLKRGDIIGKVLMDFGYFDLFKDKEFPKLGSLSWIHKPRFLNTPRSAHYPELELTGK